MTTITFVQTCSACPEQYDAYRDGEQVGYLRLRYGYFSFDNYVGPDFSRRVDGDPARIEDPQPEERPLEYHDSDGIFTTSEARDAYLSIATRLLEGDSYKVTTGDVGL